VGEQNLFLQLEQLERQAVFLVSQEMVEPA
jgi:hypothetical protein